MKVSLFVFTITVQKRKETLAEALRQEQLRKMQDRLIDQRVCERLFN